MEPAEAVVDANLKKTVADANLEKAVAVHGRVPLLARKKNRTAARVVETEINK